MRAFQNVRNLLKFGDYNLDVQEVSAGPVKPIFCRKCPEKPLKNQVEYMVFG